MKLNLFNIPQDIPLTRYEYVMMKLFGESYILNKIFKKVNTIIDHEEPTFKASWSTKYSYELTYSLGNNYKLVYFKEPKGSLIEIYEKRSKILDYVDQSRQYSDILSQNDVKYSNKKIYNLYKYLKDNK